MNNNFQEYNEKEYNNVKKKEKKNLISPWEFIILKTFSKEINT